MKFAYYIKTDRLKGDAGVHSLLERLRSAGSEPYPVAGADEITEGTDAVLSIGGDGTFLLAAGMAIKADLPIIGVNFGRLGFLSEVRPGDFPGAVARGGLCIEERELLQVGVSPVPGTDFWPYALNEVSVSRSGASMLGIDVCVDGAALPTYWADGLLVATSSGSTAYSLSVGGPICTPDTKVFIVAPISPHNLNVRPLIVPQTSRISIRLRSREEEAVLTMDNRNWSVPAGVEIEICAAPVRLKRLCVGKSNFFNALRSRLLWGEDVRNGDEQR